jgi:hypothetical protein
MDLSRFKRGDPFDVPETPDQLELMVGWFFDQIRSIVSVENHTLKFDGAEQVVAILIEAKREAKVDIRFSYDRENSQLYIDKAGSEEDILNLPKVAKEFSKIYRHDAKKFETGENKRIEEVFKNGPKRS